MYMTLQCLDNVLSVLWHTKCIFVICFYAAVSCILLTLQTLTRLMKPCLSGLKNHRNLLPSLKTFRWVVIYDSVTYCQKPLYMIVLCRDWLTLIFYPYFIRNQGNVRIWLCPITCLNQFREFQDTNFFSEVHNTLNICLWYCTLLGKGKGTCNVVRTNRYIRYIVYCYYLLQIIWENYQKIHQILKTLKVGNQFIIIW